MTDMEYYRDQLVQYRWLTNYYDGKQNMYACTNHGMDVLLSWLKITDDVKNINFVADPPTLTTDKYKKILDTLLEKKLVTAYFESKDSPMKIAPTESGHELFEAFLFWQDSEAQAKHNRNKKIKKFGKKLFFGKT